MSTCNSCTNRLESLVEKTDLTHSDILELSEPRRIIDLHFPVVLNGEKKILHGHRIQYNDTLGPTKGGLRFHESVNQEEVAELAFLMALKTSLAGLPYGGAKGGLSINPKELSKEDLELVSRAFMKELAPFIGPERDIPAPDVNTTPEIMSWMLDEYEGVVGHEAPAAITGKPLDKGGSEGRNTSTARGTFYIIEEKYKDLDKSSISVAVQGFGNAGSHVASLLFEAGYKVVAVSDSSGGVINMEGLDIPSLTSFKESGARFGDYEGEKISNEDLLELDIDILIPAALGGVITKENASNIKADTIVELANAPIDEEAGPLLSAEIIPDILANAGGVIVSYFEWRQNLDGEHWSEEEVNKKLKDMILEAYGKVLKESERQGVDLRTSAYYVAIRRIIEKK